MPKCCSFGLCKNNKANSNCRFFSFPTSRLHPERRKLWAIRCCRLNADGGVWEPRLESNSVFVCSEHFITGEPWNHKTHPDYAPSLQNSEERNTSKSLLAMRRFSSSLKRQRYMARSITSKELAKELCTLPVASSHAETVKTESDDTTGVSYDMEMSLTSQYRSSYSYDMTYGEPQASCGSSSYAETIKTESDDVGGVKFCDTNMSLPSQDDYEMSYEELKSLAGDIHIDNFSFIKDSKYITFLLLSNDTNPRVNLSVVITDTFTVHVNTFGKPLSADHEIWNHLPSKYNSRCSVELLLQCIASASLCSAVTNAKLCSMVTGANCQSLDAVLYPDGRLVRSAKCDLIVLKGKRCKACWALQRRLLMRNVRAKFKSEVLDFTTSKLCHTRNTYLSSEQLHAKLMHLTEKQKSLVREVASLKSKLSFYEKKSQNAIGSNCFANSNSDNRVMTDDVIPGVVPAATELQPNLLFLNVSNFRLIKPKPLLSDS